MNIFGRRSNNSNSHNQNHTDRGNSPLIHIFLLAYTLLALFPVFLIIINAFKTRKGIFNDPLALPTVDTFSTKGFEKVLENSDFLHYFSNSLIITLGALFFILLLGSMIAWALSEYRFFGSRFMRFFMAIGIIVPIRLGSVSILETIVSLDLVNTRSALILVYIAQGLPMAVFILTEFMAQIPKELKEAARCDDVSEYKIFFHIILPLTRPAIATVAVFSIIPIWNDLWFPLILAPGEEARTVTLGVQQFIGQYVTDWNSVLASLTLAVVPVLILYVIFSKHIIRGLTAGAVK